ncbi:MAG: type II and III secretion system protein [Marinoscillum sp.]|uniref:type II secretion system protein GspD n=1 Tax=Marinoscillum sp. TaxID=2024838 RepID=UPI003300225B
MSKSLIFYILILFAVYLGKAQGTVGLAERLDTLSKEVPGLTEKVDFTLVDAPLSELLRAVAETHQLNVNLGNIPQIAITNNFNDVLVKDLLLFICDEYHLQIKFTNNIFSFYQEKLPEVPKVIAVLDSSQQLLSINAHNDLLGVVAQEITLQSGYNLIVNQSVANQPVNAFINNLPIAQAIENFAEANNLKLIKRADRVYQISSPIPVPSESGRGGSQLSGAGTRGSSDLKFTTYYKHGRPFMSVTCNQTPASDLIRQVSEQLNINYIMLGTTQGLINCYLDSVAFEDFLGIAMESSSQSYSITENGIYLIGETEKGILNEARVYSFKNRSVQGVEEIIPQPLLKQVLVKPFNDLNALILTGSEQATNKLLNFLKDIDRSVPNVLIEVMVVEVRKGSSLRTGIKAFLADSVPTTQGQIFSGVDLTVSSATFNRVLNNLDSRGIMNLGRVTPSFYATIEAMEANNNINIRSTPKLSTLNGHEASLTIGQSVYYLIETQNVTGGVNPIVTVTPKYEKVEANLDLKINPFVSDMEDVTLSIEAEFSDFIPPEAKGAPPGNSTRKFISKIRVKNEEMVVIGGLEEASRSESGSGVPLLSRIPIIKWLFSSRSKDNIDNKLLIFIKPTVVY